jgi:hypothetical protein
MVSAYEGFHGHMYNFDKHPIAPFGTKIAIYEDPNTRNTWGEHGVDGYYLGPAPNTHRGYSVWAIGSGRKRISHKVEWYPTPYHQPLSDATDILYLSLDNIQRQLLGLSTNTSFPNIHESLIHDAVIPLKELVAKIEEGTKHYPQQTRSPTIQPFLADVHVGEHQRILRTDGLVKVINKDYVDQRVLPADTTRDQTNNKDEPVAKGTRLQRKRQLSNSDTIGRLTNTSNQPIPMRVGPYGAEEVTRPKDNKLNRDQRRAAEEEDHPNAKWIRKHL